MIKEGAKLDRETEEEHILTINAIDGGGRSENEAVSRATHRGSQRGAWVSCRHLVLNLYS